MAVDKIVPKYLNKEDDVRLVKNIEMTDALNVRISAEMNGDGGVIKNAYGNEAVSFAAGVNWQDKTHALPSGTNKVIGSVADLKDGIVIFFVWNANGDHSIYRFSTASDVAELVYRDSVLEFQADSFVKGDVIRNLSQDSLLYFTDGISSPKKINVSRAIRGGYSSVLSNGTDSEKLEFITLAKKPPLDPPTFSFFTDTTVQENNIYENTYQFAYRYVYLDGEVSAISKYSELAVSQQQLRDGLITDEQKLENNAIRVAVTTSVADVRRIEVLARNGNTGAWFIIDEIGNPSLSSEATLYTDFKNDQLYRFISTTDSDKLYDAVPLTAQSQTISGSRLFLGNYTEGYANQKNDIALWPNYDIRPIVENVTVSRAGNPQNEIKKINFDLSSISTPLAADSVLNIDFSYDFGRLQFYYAGGLVNWIELDDDLIEFNAGALIDNYIKVDCTPLSVNESIIVQAGATESDIADIISNVISGVYNVYFSSQYKIIDGGIPYATYLTDVKVINGKPDTYRYLFFKGNGELELSNNGYSPATSTQQMLFEFNACNFVPDKACKAKLFGTVNIPDLDREVNLGVTPTLVYSGDNGSFTAYTSTAKEDVGEDEQIVVGNGSTSVVAHKSDSIDGDVLYSSTFISAGISGYKGFKSGASHNLGIVYYDDRNRASGVQRAGKVYLDWYGDRENKGVSNIVMRIANSAPAWARRWSPVYVKKGSVDEFLQYSVIQGFSVTNPSAKNASISTSQQDVIYISFRSLEGKDNSYKKGKDANLEYSFVNGDKLRVVSYSGSSFPTAVDFKVVGYVNLADDQDTNPILNSTNDDTIYNTTGWFLVLEDKDVSGFSKSDIINSTDNWDDKCIVEIYRKRKEATEEVYYEIGRSYDVNVNGVMAGDRTSIPVYSIRCEVERPLQFRSDYIMYAGDIMSDGSGNSFIVTNVHASTSGSYNYYIYANLLSGSFGAASTYTVNIQNSTDCVVQLDEGDIYFRLRQFRYGKNANSSNYLVRYAEASNVSDFFTSSNTSIGRPFTVQPDAKTVYRTGSVTYSDPFLIDIQTNGLSSFNPTLANFYDLNYVHGSVRYMHNRDDSVVFLQDKKCGLFPVNRNLVEYSDGAQSLTVSTNVVGTPQYYQGDFGVNDNPESVAVESGRIYFADIRNGKVVRISRDGITPISEQGMDSYFKDLFSDIVEVASVKRVVGGVDEEAGEYIVAGPPVYTSTITIDGDGLAVGTAFQERVLDDGGTFEGLACFASAANVLFQNPVATYTLQVASDGSVIYGGVDYDDDIIFKADTEYRSFNDICDTFDNSINAVIFLDRLADGQPIIIGEEYIGTTPTTLYGIATNSTYDFFVMVTIDVARGTFVFDNSCGDYDGTIGSASQTLDSFTVAYNTDASVWNTRYSYIPENITCIDDTLYTFYNGSMYKHYSGASRSTYYGSQDGSVVEVIAAFNPSMVKTYESISLEGTASWDTTITNTDQSAVIADTDYDQRERNWYAYVPRDSSANTGTTTITALSGSSEVFALGAVDSVSGSDIVFTSDISYITFPIGASLYKVSGSTLVSITNTISSVSNETTITCGSAVACVIAVDEIVAIANGAIEGDQMRDYYAQIRLTNDSQTEIELYAINAVFAKSNLANQLGQ